MTMGETHEMKLKLTEDQLIKLLHKEQDRPAPLEQIVRIYDHESSKYPDKIRVSFEDGHTAVYDIRIEQPAPVIIENIKIIRKWKQGYVNKPMRRRNRT